MADGIVFSGLFLLGLIGIGLVMMCSGRGSDRVYGRPDRQPHRVITDSKICI